MKLRHILNICDIHEERISIAYNSIKNLLPLSKENLANLSPSEIAFLELIISRFSKLQDQIGTQIFPSLLEILEEDIHNKSFIDILTS